MISKGYFSHSDKNNFSLLSLAKNTMKGIYLSGTWSLTYKAKTMRSPLLGDIIGLVTAHLSLKKKHLYSVLKFNTGIKMIVPMELDTRFLFFLLLYREKFYK